MTNPPRGEPQNVLVPEWLSARNRWIGQDSAHFVQAEIVPGDHPPLSVSTVKADLTECDFDGYAAKTITAWNLPYLDPAGGATIQCGTQQFDFVPDTAVTNVVLGFWVETAAGVLIAVGTFPEPVAMAAAGDSIPLNVSLNYCAPAA